MKREIFINHFNTFWHNIQDEILLYIKNCDPAINPEKLIFILNLISGKKNTDIQYSLSLFQDTGGDAV